MNRFFYAIIYMRVRLIDRAIGNLIVFEKMNAYK